MNHDPMSLQDLTDRLKAEGLRLGFDQVGVAPAVAAPGFPSFLEWLDDGCAAGMGYMERNAVEPGAPGQPARPCPLGHHGEHHLRAGTNPMPGHSNRLKAEWLVMREGTTTIVSFGTSSKSCSPGCDRECPTIRGRAVIDTAPLLERDFARLAGLGWIGKNTMLINRRLGSFTFLGALLIDADLAYDAPHQANHCGTCTRCLEACPTQAFTAPYRLDARRCISYWTIEHRGVLDEENATRLHDWVFGCDICQDVCPWNARPLPVVSASSTHRPEWVNPDLIEWLIRDPLGLEGETQGDRPVAFQARGAPPQCRARARHTSPAGSNRPVDRAARRRTRGSGGPSVGGLGPGSNWRQRRARRSGTAH